MKEELKNLFKKDRGVFNLVCEQYLNKNDGIDDQFRLMDTLLDNLSSDIGECLYDVLNGYSYNSDNPLDKTNKFDPSDTFFYRDDEGLLVSTSCKVYDKYLSEVVDNIQKIDYDCLPYEVQEIIE